MHRYSTGDAEFHEEHEHEEGGGEDEDDEGPFYATVSNLNAPRMSVPGARTVTSSGTSQRTTAPPRAASSMLGRRSISPSGGGQGQDMVGGGFGAQGVAGRVMSGRASMSSGVTGGQTYGQTVSVTSRSTLTLDVHPRDSLAPSAPRVRPPTAGAAGSVGLYKLIPVDP